MSETIRDNRLKKISIISLLANSVLAVVKITVGFVSGSFAVIADGLDSSLDAAMNIIMLMTARIVKRKPNERFPYGYKKAENITSNVITFIIFSVGLQLFIANFRALAIGIEHQMPLKIAVYATVLSIVGKTYLAIWQYREGKKINSPMVVASAINMRNDIVLSISVLLGLMFTFYFKLPIIDRVISLLLSIWIMWVAIKLFKDNTVDLMDGVVDCNVYNELFDAISDIKGVHNPHRLRIRKMGYMYLVDLDIEVEGYMTVTEAHDIGIEVENRIKERLENVYDVMLHIEPIGNFEKGERFGVSDF
jgi:cation diffusion facilitator family transporter